MKMSTAALIEVVRNTEDGSDGAALALNALARRILRKRGVIVI